MAGRARAEAVSPQHMAACPVSRLTGCASAGCRRRLARDAGSSFSRGLLWVARGYGWRAVGGDNREGGRRAAKERTVRERAAEHGMLPAKRSVCSAAELFHEFFTRV